MTGRCLVIVFCACAALAAPQVAPLRGAVPAKPSSSFRVSGAVVDAASAAPLAGVRVSLAPVAHRDMPRTVTTGPDGRFVFDGLSAGKYSLGARRRGYPAQGFEQHGNFDTAIAAGPDLISEGLLFRLRPDSAISGFIRDEAGEPVSNAQVMLFRNNVTEGKRAVREAQRVGSDDEGQYRFAHLQPGQYYIAVQAHVWYAQNPLGQPADTPTSTLDVAYPFTYYPSALEASQATAISLQPGQRAAADVQLRAVSTVRLRVRIPTYDASVPVNVGFRQSAFGVQMPAQGMQYGRQGGQEVLEIAGPPGRYEMTMQVNEGENLTALVRDVDVGGAGELDARTGQSSTTVSGVVRFQGAAPYGALSLNLVHTQFGHSVSAHPAPDGSFQFAQNVPAGAYRFYVANAGGMLVKSTAAQGAQLESDILTISGAQPVRLLITLARGQARVEGVALDDGKPMAGVMVVLVPQDPPQESAGSAARQSATPQRANRNLFRRDQSDSDGTFTLSGIVAGRYTVLAIRDGWELEWSDPAVLQRYLPAGQPLLVEDGGHYNVKVTVQ